MLNKKLLQAQRRYWLAQAARSWRDFDTEAEEFAIKMLLNSTEEAIKYTQDSLDMLSELHRAILSDDEGEGKG